MPNAIKYIFAGFLLFFTNISIQSQVIDTTAKPKLILLPNMLNLRYSDKEFLTSEVKVLNLGSAPLVIRHIKPSCSCLSGTVERSSVPPMGEGKIRLGVNTINIKDSLSRVDLYIYSNQSENAVSLPIYLTKVNKDTVQLKVQN